MAGLMPSGFPGGLPTSDARPPTSASDAAIGVQSPEDVVAEIGEDHGAESDEQDDRAAIAAPAAQRAGVEVDAVEEPGEEGGCFLGIPLPVGAPGAVGPD